MGSPAPKVVGGWHPAREKEGRKEKMAVWDVEVPRSWCRLGFASEVEGFLVRIPRRQEFATYEQDGRNGDSDER